MENHFISKQEAEMATAFLEDGYLIHSVENLTDFKKIQNFIAKTASDLLGLSYTSATEFLNNFHLYIDKNKLNEFRVKLIHILNQEKWFRPLYYKMAETALQSIVGNELAMQLRVNLSIQLPKDKSSLLPMHADVWSGDSPYEVVVWVPLVDCYETKSMYILPPKGSERLQQNFFESSSEKLYERVKGEVKWINIKAGKVLLFNQNLPHGNVVNLESETRWSLNCRFKSIFSPYGDKKVGEFFEPITLKPASRVGMEYKFPIITGS